MGSYVARAEIEVRAPRRAVWRLLTSNGSHPEILGGAEIVSDWRLGSRIVWRGEWEGIWWAADRMDRTHRPYASAQYVLEIIGDYEGLWEPGGGEALMAMLRAWDENPDLRPAIDEQIRGHLRGLREDDVPPLGLPEGWDE